MQPEQIVTNRFVALNGRHPMSEADDEYCRTVFVPLPDEPDLPRHLLVELMAEGRVPMPSYILGDGTFMVHRDYADVIRRAGGPDGLREWFLASWPPAQEEVAAQEWEAYLSGQYVCLYSVTPDTIRAKDTAIEAIKAAVVRVEAHPDDAHARAELASAVDVLDRLEPPFADYDRARFAGPVSRDVWIDDIRRTYLAG